MPTYLSTHGAGHQRPKQKPKHLENVMSKIIELNLAETKTVVGGAAVAANQLVVHKIPTGSVSMPPVDVPMGQNAPPSAPKRF
jgi:hypothetical protein